MDEEFYKMLIKIIGAPVLQKFRNEKTSDYIDLERELEMKKRTITPKTKGKITLKVPVSLSEIYKNEEDEPVTEAVEGTSYSGKLQWLQDKIRIDAELFKSFFKPCKDKIVEHLKELLLKPEIKGTNTMLMVGGFSDSELMQDTIMKAFPQCTVIIPEDAGLCVLKGAVIFGHRPVAITARVSKYTYGINISPPFDQDNHPPNRRVHVGGMDRCRDVFKKYIEEGDAIRVGEVRSGKHITLSSHQTEMMLNIYASTKKNPVFVDEEGAEHLGQVIVKLPDKDEKIRVEVNMMFGETELAVEAVELSTNTKYTSFFDFL